MRGLAFSFSRAVVDRDESMILSGWVCGGAEGGGGCETATRAHGGAGGGGGCGTATRAHYGAEGGRGCETATRRVQEDVGEVVVDVE